MAGESFILMGVSGSGKTLIGSKVAALLSAKFIDGDDLHPAKNIDKMSQGIPLSDEDRLPWLERLNDASYSLYKKNETGFIVCSSLKKQYRDILRKGSPHVHFLWLDGDYGTILARMQRRAGHFMPVALLKSQFEALERPQADEQDIVRIDINHDIANVTEQCRQAVLAIRQNRICAKEGSASDQRCE
ncbi:gluconokinase [Escherichia coli]